MLTKDELETYKRFADPYFTEKDYLQELILHYIYSNRESTRSFVFKGGTALSKFYYSDRFSEDLDFTLLETDETGDKTISIVEQIAGNIFYSIEFIKKPSHNRFKTISAEFDIKGPRYNGKQSSLQHIRLEINTVSGMLHKPLQLPRRQTYGDIDEYIGTVMDKDEILSEKFRAIASAGRYHKERDLYDINFLLGKKTVPKRIEIVKKFEEAGKVFSKDELVAAIDAVGPSWKELEPFVSHRLDEYKNVRSNVIAGLEAAKVL